MTTPRPAPMPFQRHGIDFLDARTRAFLCDDAGLGKSMQMITAANEIGAKRILILTPVVGKGAWRLQFEQWDAAQRPVMDIASKKPIPAGPVAVIVSLEWLSRDTAKAALLAAIDASGEDFDVAFVDEAHNLKNDTAQRTRSVYGARMDLKGSVLARAKVRWLATATPTPLNVGELYPHLRALFPDVLLDLFHGKVPSRRAFEEHFCSFYESKFGRTITGNNHLALPALRAAITPHFLMRKKADVYTELPPIVTMMLPITTGFKDPYGLTDADVEAMTDGEVQALFAAIQTPTGDEISPRAAFGSAKAKAVLPWVDGFIAGNPTGAKLLIFGHHRAVLSALFEHLTRQGHNPAMIFGGMTTTKKSAEVARFQSDPACKVFIGQNVAAGTAITLTAADTVLILEPHASPDQNYQIISRAHRIGQTNTVTAVIAYDDTVPLDRRQAKLLQARAEGNLHLFGHHTPGVL